MIISLRMNDHFDDMWNNIQIYINIHDAWQDQIGIPMLLYQPYYSIPMYFYHVKSSLYDEGLMLYPCVIISIIIIITIAFIYTYIYWYNIPPDSPCCWLATDAVPMCNNINHHNHYYCIHIYIYIII